MNAPVFHLQSASKAYRFFRLEPLELSLEPGQVMGLVGPNGAGKSTTIRLLMGLVQPDAGRVEVLGRPMATEAAEAKRDIGYVTEDMRLFAAETVQWHLDLMASLYPTWDAAYARELMRRFGLQAMQVARGLSRGEQLKALLLMTLARRPRLIVLDEPTSGLDPVARHEMLGELMQVLRDDDRSVLFSSHNTLDVERICDQIAFIDRGRLVDVRDKDGFLESWRRVQLDVPDGARIERPRNVVDFNRSGRTAVATVRDWTPATDAAFERQGFRVHAVQRMSLEEIFVATVMASREETHR